MNIHLETRNLQILLDFHHFRASFKHFSYFLMENIDQNYVLSHMLSLFDLSRFQSWNQNENPPRNEESIDFLRLSSFSGSFAHFSYFLMENKSKFWYWVMFSLFALRHFQKWNQNKNPSRNKEITEFLSFSSFSGNFCILFLLSDWKYKSKLFYWVMVGLFALRHFQNWNQNKNPSRNKEITEFLRFSSFLGNFCIFFLLSDWKYKLKLFY